MVIGFKLVVNLGGRLPRKGQEENIRGAFNFLFLNLALVLWHIHFWESIMAYLLFYVFLCLSL